MNFTPLCKHLKFFVGGLFWGFFPPCNLLLKMARLLWHQFIQNVCFSTGRLTFWLLSVIVHTKKLLQAFYKFAETIATL